jgi:hypothetical protein
VFFFEVVGLICGLGVVQRFVAWDFWGWYQIRCINEKRLAFFVTPAHFHRIFRVMGPVLYLYVTATGKLPVAFFPLKASNVN